MYRERTFSDTTKLAAARQAVTNKGVCIRSIFPFLDFIVGRKHFKNSFLALVALVVAALLLVVLVVVANIFELALLNQTQRLI